jgi:hypothetical protein
LEKIGASMIKRQTGKSISRLIAAAAVLASFNAQADTYSFGCISAPTTDAACVSGENYLRMDVTSADSGSRAQFDFYFASGSTLGNIHEIYFDNGPLDQLVSNVGTAGVAYKTALSGDTTNPAALPGGGSAPGGAFIAQVSLSADSTGGGLDGVEGGTNEHLYLQFSLLNGKTFNDVLSALSGGDLRVGLHVGALNDGDSRSYVNVTPIPEPEIYAMMGLGLGLMGFVARRRKQQATA